MERKFNPRRHACGAAPYCAPPGANAYIRPVAVIIRLIDLVRKTAASCQNHASCTARLATSYHHATFYNADDDCIRTTVTSREELEQYLCDVARTVFYANAPRGDGEFLYKCDDDGIVWTALTRYKEQLEEFFGDDDAAGT